MKIISFRSTPQDVSEHEEQADISDSNNAKGNSSRPRSPDNLLNPSDSFFEIFPNLPDAGLSTDSAEPEFDEDFSYNHDEGPRPDLEEFRSEIIRKLPLVIATYKLWKAKYELAALKLKSTQAVYKRRLERSEHIQKKIMGLWRDIEQWERAGVRVYDEDDGGENWQIQELLDELHPLELNLNALERNIIRLRAERSSLKANCKETCSTAETMEEWLGLLESGKWTLQRSQTRVLRDEMDLALHIIAVS